MSPETAHRQNGDRHLKTILIFRGQDDRRSAWLIRNNDGSLRVALSGNVPIKPAFDGLATMQEVILGLAGNPDIEVPSPDLVINLICDADANRQSLLEAVALVKEAGTTPILNHPEHVLKTTRQAIAQMASEIAGLMAPPVMVVRPRRLREIEEFWRSGGMPADFLIRPLTGETHGGKNLLRVSSEADFGALEQFPFDGGAFGITPFVDYRSADGYYRKYRIFFVNGEAYPRHLIMNEDWMIHSKSRLGMMIDRPDLHAEEQRFLSNPREVLGRVAWEAVHELARRTKLNFVGIDFSLLPDGRALLFECNPGMDVLGQGAGGGNAYLTPFVEQIKAALRNMAARRL